MNKTPVILAVLFVGLKIYKKIQQQKQLSKASEEHFLRDEFLRGKHD